MCEGVGFLKGANGEKWRGTAYQVNIMAENRHNIVIWNSAYDLTDVFLFYLQGFF